MYIGVDYAHLLLYHILFVSLIYFSFNILNRRQDWKCLYVLDEFLLFFFSFLFFPPIITLLSSMYVQVTRRNKI